MPTYTRTADRIITLTRTGGGSFTPDSDGPNTVGRGDGGSSSITRRLRVRVPEPTWPSTGRLVDAWISVERADGSSYPDWRGGSPRLSVRRMTDGDTTAGAAVEFAVGSGRTRRKVTSQVRRMLPTRLGGGNEHWGLFLLQSSDESNPNRSMVLTSRVQLTVEIDTRVIPAEAQVLEVVGAQDGQGDPTIVATPDGRTLEVRFAFAAGPNETAKSVTLEMRVAGATDAVPGTLIRSVTMTPLAGGGANIHLARLTGMPQGTEGRYRLRATSSSGMQGPWTSLDDAEAHVKLATIPGAPVNVVVEPTTDDPEISASLPSTHQGSITRMEAEVTLLPQGRVQRMDSDIGGSVRRATLVYSGEALADGQQTSTRVRLTDQDGVVGVWGAPVTTTHHAPPPATGPEITTASQRFLTLRPTFTIAASTFDGWRLQLLHETDDTIVVYDSQPQPVTDQTSVDHQVPAGALVYGQRFRARTAVVPNGGGTTYGDWTDPKPYSIAALPTMTIRAQDAVAGKVGVEDIPWLLGHADPDGAALGAFDLDLRAADTPQGDGALHRRWYHAPGATWPIETVPGGSVTFESAVDARVRGHNDVSALAATTLDGALTAGATTGTLASASGFAIGQDIVVASTDGDEHEVRRIANLVSTTVTFDQALAYDHASGQAVTARAFGPWSPWLTVTALEPPDVDLLSPIDGAIVVRPWRELDWVTTGHGGRTQASALVGLYDADGQAIASVDIDDTTSDTTIPAFLLDDATGYEWDVTVTDSSGMVTTSERRTFTTAFTEPLSVVSATAEPDEDGAGVVVSWLPDPDEQHLHHYEVSWLDDTGHPVRIDGGPEAYGDGRTPFTGTTLTHLGARLGDNTYVVAGHNGWRSAEPVNTTTTLPWSDPAAGTWEAVRADGTMIPLRVMDGSVPTPAMLDAQQPPGAPNRAIAWGIGARRLPMRVLVRPAVDGPLATTLRLLMADPSVGRTASPCWIRPPAGYALDPLWMVLESFTPTPGAGGTMDVPLEWLEVGPPVHAILPPVAEALLIGVGDLVSDTAEIDFGEVSA